MPAIRAMLAEKLATKHGMKQTDVAKLLGVSQPAISLYYRRLRGTAIDMQNDKDITRLAENLADSLTKNRLSRREFVLRLCEICRTIRAKGLLCEIHRAFEPSIKVEKCELCKTADLMKCP